MKGNVLALMLVLLMPIVASGYDLNEKVSIEGTLTGVYQYVSYDKTIDNLDDRGSGANVFDIGINVHPTDVDEFQLTLGFAADNALNDQVPFTLAPYADDLEDDFKNINGRNRDYLLEAWYKHTFTISENIAPAVTWGIIDSTGYIDDNNFANDEVAQFMNDIFVNNTIANLPSYEPGGVAELDISNLSIRGLVINSNTEIDEDKVNNYNYYAGQLGYKLETGMGEGNYRLYGFITTERFAGFDGKDDNSLSGFGISADQQLGEIIGAFLRLGLQNDDAVIDHDQVYSGGINIIGKPWAREEDNIGIGFAYFDGPDKGDIKNTTVFEVYYKFQIVEYSDISLDFQYINDEFNEGTNENSGYIYGGRLNAYF